MKDLSVLTPAFRFKVDQLLYNCKENGITMVPFFTERDVHTQAKLWRQSRSGSEVRKAIQKLKSEKAYYLAEVLEKVGPQYGRWATNALPGQSWHQWGLAIDSYWLVKGRVVWSTSQLEEVYGHLVNGYKVYAKEAELLNLVNLGQSYGDWVHVGAEGTETNPVKLFGWEHVDDRMVSRFSY